MAFLMAPLCLLLFGIVVYGYLMSFRQNMTQAAAEGARAGAVATADAPTYTNTIAIAKAATNKALGSFGEACDNGRTTCTVVVNASVNGTSCPSATASACITVTVSYDYGGHPLMPDIPIVSSAIPSTFVSSSSAQLNT
jgi:Flp pilus assembly protein TadG